MPVIDGRGKFLVPGLWDMHAHVWKLAEQLQLPLYVAHGVTGVRDMLSWPDDSDAKGLELTGRAHAAGIKVLAGTDHPVAGASLHQELEELVKAGLSPRAALRAASHDAAVFLKKNDRFGCVRAGRIADLVLLDADPRRSIANTRRIAMVSVAGRRYDRQHLDALLAFTEGQAASWSLGCKILWAVLKSAL